MARKAYGVKKGLLGMTEGAFSPYVSVYGVAGVCSFVRPRDCSDLISQSRRLSVPVISPIDCSSPLLTYFLLFSKDE